MRIRETLMAPALMLAGAALLLGQDREPRRPQGQQPDRQRQRPDAAQTFQRFDKNEDGVLEESELPGGPRRRFARADANEDGKLSLKEFETLFRNRRAARAGGRAGEKNTPPARGERQPDKLKVGDEAPDFTLADPEGKNELTLSSFEGKKPVVLIFGSYT